MLAVLALVPACSERGSAAAARVAIITLPDNPSLPYRITAIDYHFHDAHPTVPLAPTRTVMWTNDGSLVHNITFPEIGYSKDIPVGRSVRIKDLGKRLGGPGTYTFYCAYHENLGMTGTIIIK